MSGEIGGRLVAVGEIGRPHGLAGELRVTPLSDDPDRLAGLSECIVWHPGSDARERRRLVAVRRQGDAVIVALEGCRTVEAARSLAGRLLAVPESQARPLLPGQFYPWQLEGCRVVDVTGAELGTVSGLERGAGHDLWIVRAAGGREHLIPAVAPIVREVDLAARRVVIAPPEGLLEL